VPGILQDLRVRRVGILAALQTAEGLDREAAVKALAEIDEQLQGFGQSGQLVIAETDQEVGR
jgi:hypothetical protein